MRAILEVLNEVDVRWIDLWPVNVEGGDPARRGWRHRFEGRDIDQAEAALNEHGIGVACVTMPGGFAADLAAEPDDYLDALTSAIDVAAALRAPLVNSYAYHLCRGGAPAASPLIEILRAGAHHAAARGVTLCLENEAHDATATAAGMRCIIEAVGSPALRTTFDPANYYQASDEPFPAAYEELRELIGYVHVKGARVFRPGIDPDWQRGGTITRRESEANVGYPPLPDGAVNTEQLLRRILTDRVSSFCTLEPHVPTAYVEAYYRAEVPYLRCHGVH